MRLAILIASTGKGSDPRRARAAYLRETPARIEAQVIICTGRNLRHAWKRGLATVGEMEWIHFGAEWLEPHPGWTTAAVAGGGKVVAPVLWSADGEPLSETRDWAAGSGCDFPTLNRAQLRKFGLPPFPSSQGVHCVVRTNYAFTVLD